MNDAQKAVQLLSPGFKVGLDDPEEAARLVELGVGGFCLYAGDVESVAELTSSLQARARRPLLFNADYEDGLPTHCAGGTPLPANMALGAADDEALAEKKGAVTAEEARAVGVHWVLGPVCDLATNHKNPIVNVRAFSDDPGRVARLARAYLRGLRSRRVLGCVKHFPGHGETKRDSHLELPAVEADLATLERRELAPFAQALPEADAVMTGHLLVPALAGDGAPYSLSSDVARTLRGKLGFSGLVSTDALNMRAIADNFDELDAAKRALLGGSDILLVPKDPRALARGLAAAVEQDEALARAVRDAYGRLEKARAAAGLTDAASWAVDPARVGRKENLEQAERLAQACLSWAGTPPPPLPREVFYLEPEADGPSEWLGETFVAALRAQGLEVKPYGGAPGGAPVVLGCFLGPHAYTGVIEYDDDLRARAAAALASAPGSLIACFGSPFVFEALRAPGLCAFGRSEPAQRAAALALTGKLAVKGAMPVRLSR